MSCFTIIKDLSNFLTRRKFKFESKIVYSLYYRVATSNFTSLSRPQDGSLAQPDSSASKNRSELHLPIAQFPHPGGSGLGRGEEQLSRLQTKCRQQGTWTSSWYSLHDPGRIPARPSPTQQHAQEVGGGLEGCLLLRVGRGVEPRWNSLSSQRNSTSIPLSKKWEQAEPIGWCWSGNNAGEHITVWFSYGCLILDSRQFSLLPHCLKNYACFKIGPKRLKIIGSCWLYCTLFSPSKVPLLILLCRSVSNGYETNLE